MTDATNLTPSNPNFLLPLHFAFHVKKTPNLNWYVQTINIPGVHLPPVEIQNPFVKVPYPGDHIQYDDIMINFKVDEGFANWLELYNWIKKMGYPNEYAEYRSITAPTVPVGEGIKSDISLIIMNSSRIPKINIIFKDAFPVSLSSLIFDSTKQNPDPIDASCTFRYTSYELEVIS